MIHEEQIEIARKNFLLAAKEFDFTLISPYCLDKEKGLYAFGYLPEYGSSKGAVICLMSSPEYQVDEQMQSWCNAHGFFCGFLNVKPLEGEYSSSYFKELLDDWKAD